MAPLDQQKTGFIVCPHCGTVNAPERPAHRLPHHVIHSTKPTKLWHRLYQHRLFVPGAAALIVLTIGFTIFALQKGENTPINPIKTPVITKL